ncbi:MAG TPA: hypothetical protein VMF61_02105 [Candidatus Acidoferrales bacterium]|nr:hypothetical protein [Candidatus Acidoferrales bacterium]
MHSVHLRLGRLIDSGLVAGEGSSYVYAAPPEADELVRRLAELYADRRTAVIERIFSEPRDPLQSFADAFRLRKEVRDDE